MRTGIIGGGGWGLALAKLLAENNQPVLVWEHNSAFLQTLQDTHSNPVLLPGIKLPESIAFTGSFRQLTEFEPELLILATPSQYLRSTLELASEQTSGSFWSSARLEAVVDVAKGIENNTLLRMSEVLREFVPPSRHGRICVLSGPSHAEEVARGVPTTVVIAGEDEALLKALQQVFSNNYFRVYRSSDPVGVEIGGAVKNIIAIAAGIIAGLSFGDNTIGALLTRGLVEIQRFGVACGARAETFLGLSGVGDLVTTATSQHSRNRHVGFELGKGRKLKEIVAGMPMVAEGVVTTNSVRQLALRLEVEMPITEQVWQILYADKDPRRAIVELMTRELKPE